MKISLTSAGFVFTISSPIRYLGITESDLFPGIIMKGIFFFFHLAVQGAMDCGKKANLPLFRFLGNGRLSRGSR